MATYVIWHGYLLGGSGSNIYSTNIARQWAADGHTVVLMCQDPHPERTTYISERRRLQGGDVEVTTFAEHGPLAGRCTMVQPDLGGVLPVYCLDRYAGFEVVRFAGLDDERIDAYVAANRAAMQYVLDEWSVDGVLINHAVMGPESLRPVLEASGVPYVVKIHGSELEYAIAEDARYVAPAQRALAGARSILVGSDHVARRMNELLGEECSDGRVEVVPPGVDMELFAPPRASRSEAWQALTTAWANAESDSHGRSDAIDRKALAALSDPSAVIRDLGALHGTYEERDPEHGTSAWLESLNPNDTQLVTFVGKGIRQKGAQLVLAALPLVWRQHPHARFMFVGFGSLREWWQAFARALSRGDEALIDELVAHGQVLDGGVDEPFAFIAAWYESLRARGEWDAYLAAAHGMEENIRFTGQVGHAVLPHLWGLTTINITPSVFPEAFGMVAAEAAASGAIPVVAMHSGLAEVGATIASRWPEDDRALIGFSLDDDAPIGVLARSIDTILGMTNEHRSQLARAARAVVAHEWSWGAICGRIEAQFSRVTAG